MWGVVEDIVFVSGLWVWWGDDQCVVVCWVVKMQCCGSYVIIQSEYLFIFFNLYWNWFISVWVISFGGDYQIKFFWQWFFIFNFYVVV